MSNENIFYRMEIYILSNENIFLSNENNFYRMQIYFYRMQIYFYRMQIIFIEFCYISATIMADVVVFVGDVFEQFIGKVKIKCL